MRHKSKLLLVAIIATLAVSAVGSASASAAPGFKINGSAFTGTETITTKLTSSTLAFEINFGGSLDLTVNCSAVSSTGGKILESVKFSVEKFTLTGCKIVSAPSCKFATETLTPTEKLETLALTGQVFEEGGKDYVKLINTASGNRFMSFRFAETGCGSLDETKYSLHGEIRCQVSTSVEEVTKGCEFTATSGSDLTLEGGSAHSGFLGTFGFALSGTNVGKIWGVV